MKKSTKIVLLSAAGVALSIGVGLGIYYGLENHDLSGSITDTEAKKDWEKWYKNKVEISYGIFYENKCYSSRDKDHIYHILFEIKDNECLKITYALDFSLFDEFETYFVFNNGYTSPVEHSSNIFFGDYIELDEETTSKYDFRKSKITEVWCRTLD